MKSYSLNPSFGPDVAPFYERVNMTIQFPIRPGCLFAALGKGYKGGVVSHWLDPSVAQPF
jgi:hypothetical protein